ncbi:MAG TPA: SRPBCC family protein [Pseudonocardiaceae bacterium]|nr:SRPBCC family protein [Pseudonocardiaceae bacterium]
MLIENSFQVAADPDQVFDFLQDANNVVACMPGAELVEDLGNDSYRGKVKIKIGPVTAAYTGTATITQRDAGERVAILLAEGRDTKGNGSAKATATMRVSAGADGVGSAVLLHTDLSVSGRLAQFGRSVMADVSNRMVGEMATRVRDTIEAAHQVPTDSGAATADGNPPGAAPATTTAPAARPPAGDDAIKASSIAWSVLAGVFRRLFARLRGRDVSA